MRLYCKSLMSGLLAVGLCLPLTARSAAVCEPAAAQALAAHIDRFWQARDAAGMASLYAEDASLVLEPGTAQARGRAAVQRFFGHVFKGLETGNEHHMKVLGLQTLDGICAMDARAMVGVPAAGAAAQGEFAGFYVLRPAGQDLQILAVRAFNLK